MSLKSILHSIPVYLAVWAGLFLLHNAWLTLIGFHIVILLVLAFTKPNIRPKILLESKNKGLILFNILLGGLSGFGIYYLRDLFGVTADLASHLAGLGLTSSTWPAFIAYFSLVNPFIEEYFWHAHLGSSEKGLQLVDLLYAGYHFIVLLGITPLLTNLFSTACLALISWLWRQIKRRDGGLLAPVLGHMSADFSILTAVFILTT
jgi:hypothetical protein